MPIRRRSLEAIESTSTEVTQSKPKTTKVRGTNPADDKPIPAPTTKWGSEDYQYWLKVGAVYNISFLYRRSKGHNATTSLYGYTYFGTAETASGETIYKFFREGSSKPILVLQSDIHEYTSFRLADNGEGEAADVRKASLLEAQEILSMWNDVSVDSSQPIIEEDADDDDEDEDEEEEPVEVKPITKRRFLRR